MLARFGRAVAPDVVVRSRRVHRSLSLMEYLHRRSRPVCRVRHADRAPSVVTGEQVCGETAPDVLGHSPGGAG